MAKGFGSRSGQKLGYVLSLIPKFNAYAADFGLDKKGGFFKNKNNEPFIGITNILKDAQIWKTAKQARECIPLYADVLTEDFADEPDIQIHIKSIQRNNQGELVTKFVESVHLLTIEGNK